MRIPNICFPTATESLLQRRGWHCFDSEGLQGSIPGMQKKKIKNLPFRLCLRYVRLICIVLALSALTDVSVARFFAELFLTDGAANDLRHFDR